MAKKKDEVKDVVVVKPRKNDIEVKRHRDSEESEKADAKDEEESGMTGSTEIVLADRRGEVAALTMSDLAPQQKFDKKSPVIMIWDNRSNQWMNFRSLEEVAELFGEVEVYVALPTFYKKLKRGFREA